MAVGGVPVTRVASSVRALPGGHAFAELLEDDTEGVGFALFGVARIKELFQKVRAFLAALRKGLFGFVDRLHAIQS